LPAHADDTRIKRSRGKPKHPPRRSRQTSLSNYRTKGNLKMRAMHDTITGTGSVVPAPGWEGGSQLVLS